MSTEGEICHPVSATGEVYDLPSRLAHAFASAMGIKDPRNFARAMDPSDTTHLFVEHWQALYNVRWLEKLDSSGQAVEWMLVWGQPKHSMEMFHRAAKTRWPQLPPWNTFRQAVSENATRTLKGFRVMRLPLEESRARLQERALPEALKAKVRSPTTREAPLNCLPKT